MTPVTPVSAPLDPDAAADAYREALPPGRLEELRLDPLDRLGVPVVSVTHWPPEGSANVAVGYGLTEAEARRGSYGEMTETAHSAPGVARLPRLRRSWADLVAERGERGVLDPRLAPLPAGSPWTPDTVLTWVPMRRWEREAGAGGGPAGGPGGEVLVPVELVASSPSELRPEAGDPGPEACLTLPITNGMGAGMTVEQALAHALLEIVQRNGNGISFRAMDQGVAVDLDGIADPAVIELLERFDTAGVDVTVKVADTAFGIPNLVAVGCDRPGREQGAPIMATAGGEAAHPDLERAVRKALVEYANARPRKAFAHGPLDAVEAIVPPGYLERVRAAGPDHEEERALRGMVEWTQLSWDDFRELLAPVLQVRERVPLSSLPTVEGAADLDPAELCALVVDRLAAEGLEVLMTELTPPGCPVAAVKVLVPSLEVETMTYHRIGARNVGRLLGRGSPLVGLGTPPAGASGARPVLLTDDQRAQLGGPAWFDVDAVDRVVGRLYPMYREPGRHIAQLVASGELQV